MSDDLVDSEYLKTLYDSSCDDTIYSLAQQLLKERDEALAKAEAYREVAIRYERKTIRPPEADREQIVDAEVAKILSERKSKGVEK